MRFVLFALALAGALALPLDASAGRLPEPLECPADPAEALEEVCPCDGRELPNGDFQPWRSHGQYVSCAARFRNALRRAGCLDAAQRRSFARCAARSTCGRPAAIVCCLGEAAVCLVGEEDVEGVCSHDAAVACEIDEDCTTYRGRLMRSEEACEALGGEVGDEGSVCRACDYLLP
jgi:hypothetical protein